MSDKTRRNLLLKFFGSLCLLGFLAGLMFGKLFNDANDSGVNQVISVAQTEQGVELCFSKPPVVKESKGQGFYWLRFDGVAAVKGDGDLLLAEKTRVRWQLRAYQAGVQLGFVSLSPVTGRWSVNANCVSAQIALSAP